jgi:Superfamily II DNA helicase
MLLEGLLQKDIEEYGVLKFTKKGVDFLKKPKSFKIVLNNTYEEANADDDEGAETTEGAAADEKLFEMLKELRQKEAKKKNLPPLFFSLNHHYRIWQPFIHYTTDLEKCQGVSKGKAIRYGKPFIDLISNMWRKIILSVPMIL